MEFSKKTATFLIFVFQISLIIIDKIKSIQIEPNCPSGKYYDTGLYDCLSCPLNMVPRKDGLGCTCNSLSYYVFNNLTIMQSQAGSSNFNMTQCAKCPDQSVASQDRSVCQKCPGEIENGECVCTDGYIIQERDLLTNRLLETKQCTMCPGDTFPGPTGPKYKCIPCDFGKAYDKNRNPWLCLCDLTKYVTAGDICIPLMESLSISTSYPVNTAKSLTLGFAETTDPLQDSVISVASSDTIEWLYLKSGYKCLKESDIESCNALANICVLQMYDEENSACKLYKSINNLKKTVINSPDPGWKEGMPWLYYENKANNVINNTEKIDFSVSFDPNDGVDVSLLQFFIAKYDIYGKYYGMEPLSNQITLCSENYEDALRYRRFGSVVVQNCAIDLSKYLTRNYTMYFYEIFLLDPTTNKFIDIPVMIDNIPNPLSFDKNRMNNGTIPENWILTRRFFLIDNLSALQTLNSFMSKNDVPIALRFPKLIKLIILLQNISKPKIMVPYFEIMYKSKLKTFIDNFPDVYVNFISEYKMNIENFKSTMLGVFIGLNALVGVIVTIKMYIWYKLNPPALSPDNYFLWFIGNAIIKLFADWGKIMFWFCWGISAYWFLFFKFQYRVFILLPQYNNWKENYASFDVVFGIACSAYTVYMCYRVYRQVNIDIFFIDWEHEKEILIKNATELRPEKYRGAWRLVYVANQFNELQKKRYISFAFSFFWVVFAWWYLEWGSVTQSIPGLIQRSYYSPENYVLRHFVGTFVLLCSGIGHLMFYFFFQNCIPLSKQEFIDLCCVSNISVFILDQSLHGYYIHGISPAGKADSNLDELLNALEEEGTGKVKGRGLIEKDNDNLQTYELFVSYKMRTVYDGIYGLQSENMILSAENTDKMQNQSRISNFLRALPKTLQIDILYKLKSYMNTTLKDKIQKISNQPLRYVKEKTKLQRFLNYPPIELVGDTTDDIVLFKDPNMNFDEVLLSGIEWEWYLWDIFVYQMWMLTLNSCAISIFLTFICDKILYTARAFWGEKNLSRKAIVDNKFFMSNSNH